MDILLGNSMTHNSFRLDMTKIVFVSKLYLHRVIMLRERLVDAFLVSSFLPAKTLKSCTRLAIKLFSCPSVYFGPFTTSY